MLTTESRFKVPSEKPDLLAEAIGRCLARSRGLVAAYIPFGAGDHVGESIVRSINRHHSTRPPHAILVTRDQTDERDSLCLRLSTKSAIKYRQGDRVAVVEGKHPDLASFVQAFVEGIGDDFPKGNTGLLTIHTLAQESLLAVMDEAGVSTEVLQDLEAVVHSHAQALQLLADTYERGGSGSISWSAFWYRHVRRGLSNLAAWLKRSVHASQSLDADKAITGAVRSCYSLPQDHSTLNAKSFYDATNAWWATPSQIQSSIEMLAHHGEATDTSVEELSSIDWSQWDDIHARPEHDHPLLALHLTASASQTHMSAFNQLTAGQFLEPSASPQAVDLLLLHPETQLPLNQVLGLSAPHLIPMEASEGCRDGVAVAISSPILLQVPFLERQTASEVSPDSIRVKVSPTRFNWEPECCVELEDGNVAIRGRFLFPVKDRFKGRDFTLTVSGGSDVGTINSTARCKASTLPHLDGAVSLFAIRGKRLSANTYAEAPEGEGDTIDVTGAPSFLIVVKATHQTAACAGTAMERWELDRSYRIAKFSPQAGDTLDVGDTSYEFQNSSTRNAPVSPLLAAINCDLIAQELPAGAGESVRGEFEDLFIGQDFSNDDWVTTLGHLAMPEGEAGSLKAVRVSSHHPIFVHPQFDDALGNSSFSIHEGLLTSPALASFRRALNEVLRSLYGGPTSEGEPRRWPSQTSLRELWSDSRDVLNNYLLTYAELIDEARKFNDPSGMLWVSYPNCISVWDDKANACKAVLLSPLHPIRLAWLASAEHTLWDAEEAASLAGLVEGWNWPLIGPGSTKTARLLAVPTDNGPEQIFLGWSMLVRVSIESPEGLTPPTEIGGQPAPGTAASGLNKSAVQAALKTYSRINPHVATLVMDLASGIPTARLPEIDSAVVGATRMWAGDEALGIRVLDSTQRLGEPPFEELAQFLAEGGSVPVTWSRYSTDEAPRSNIRFLQDAGAGVMLNTYASEHSLNVGVSPSLPLRRFVAPVASDPKAKSLKLFPSVYLESGWDQWTKALRAIESSRDGNELSLQLNNSLLADGNADWTVTGETLMGPAGLAHLIQKGKHENQLLWEWHPPLLRDKGTQLTERRPYISVVQIPVSFRTEIEAKLAKAARGQRAVDVDDLLATLGTRGIGLSSLVAMGGTHAAGALGFYLALKLCDALETTSSEEVEFLSVLPLDAVDGFLQALAGLQESVNSRKRADLLLLRMTQETLQLVPIEIKFYGLDSQAPKSSVSDSAFSEAAYQARATHSQLMAVAAKCRSRQSSSSALSADESLWFSALTALVESAFNLSPVGGDHGPELAARLARLSNGEIPVRVGKPLVTYFQATQVGSPDLEVQEHRLVGDPDVLVLSSGSATAFRALSTGSESEHDLLKVWKQLYEQATDDAAPGEELAAVVQHPLPSTAATPEETDDPDSTEGDALASADPPDHPEPAVPVRTHPPSNSSEAVTSTNSAMPPSVVNTPIKLEAIQGDGVRFTVGERLHALGATAVDYWPSNTKLTHMNMGVLGNLGTGKTQMLKALLAQLRTKAATTQPSGLSVLVFDYKQDFRDQDFLARVGGVVYLPHRIPLNVLALNGAKPHARAKSFIDVLEKIYSGIGPVQKSRLGKTIRDLYHDDHEPLLDEVLEQYLDYSDGKPDAVSAILENFVYGEVFSNDRDELMTFEELIDNKVAIIALNELGTDQDSKNAIVALFLNQYYEYMLKQPKWPFQGANPQLRRLNSFLLVDEAWNIMNYGFQTLKEILVQGREFGVGVILSSQYLSQFKTKGVDYTEPLRTWFIHQVPSISATELKSLGVNQDLEATCHKIQTLSQHECFYRSLEATGVFMRGKPFYEYVREAGTSGP